MDYAVKVIIGGVEVMEAADTVTNADNVTYQPPWISAITLYDNGTSGTMQIGATPSDKLTFTLNSPHKQNFDGELVELWVSPPDDEADDVTEMTDIDDEVGADETVEGVDEEEDTNEMEDEDDGQGEDADAEEIETSDEEQEVNIEDRFTTFEGEDDTIVDEETDEGEEPDWFRVGIFYVHSQKTTTDRKSIMLTCYDTMQMLTGTFTPSSATATIQAMFNDLRAQVLTEYGVTIDAFDYDTYGTQSIAWSWDVSYREALGWFAGLMGGYATCGDDGSIGFSIYSYQDGLYLDTALNWFDVDPSSEVEIDGIRCNVGGLSEKYLESGEEPDITFSNPLMTQDILDDILATYHGVHFFGGSMSMGWDDTLHAGTLVRVMTADEYQNYVELQNALADGETDPDDIPMIKDSINNLGTVMLVGQQVVDFNGDANATIYSNSASVTASMAARPTLTEVATGAAKTAKATNQYFWHTQTDTGAGAGAHVTEIPREDFLDDPQNGGGNVLLTSTGMDVRDGTDVLATFGADGARIGLEDDPHMYVTYGAVRMIDEEGREYFYVGDDRDAHGHVTETFTGTGTKHNFDLSSSPDYRVTVISVTVNGNELAPSDYQVTSNSVYITVAPPNGADIIIVYTPHPDDELKAFTFGTRASGTRGGLSVSYGKNNLVASPLSFVIGQENETIDDEDSNEVFIFGNGNYSSGTLSSMLGRSLKSNHDFQLVIGLANASANVPFIIGNGNDNTTPVTRSNAFSVSWQGDVFASGDVYVEGTSELDPGYRLPIVQSGHLGGASVSANSYLDRTVTFDKAFPSAPTVVCSIASTATAGALGSFSVSANSITTTGFTARVFNASSGSRTPGVDWIAVY